jgi:hypothetical protein
MASSHAPVPNRSATALLHLHIGDLTQKGQQRSEPIGADALRAANPVVRQGAEDVSGCHIHLPGRLRSSCPGEKETNLFRELPGQLLPRRSHRGSGRPPGKKQTASPCGRTASSRPPRQQSHVAGTTERRLATMYRCLQNPSGGVRNLQGGTPGVLGRVRVTGGDTRQADRRVINCCPAEVTRS